MNKSTIIRLSELETKIDNHLFAQPDPDDLHPVSNGVNAAGAVAGAGAAGLAGYGGYKAVQAAGGIAPALGVAKSGLMGAWDVIKSKLAKGAPEFIGANLSTRGWVMELAAKCEKKGI